MGRDARGESGQFEAGRSQPARDEAFEPNQAGLKRAVDLISEYWSDAPMPPASFAGGRTGWNSLSEWIEQIPELGLGEEQVLEWLAPEFLRGSARFHVPGYFAHMEPPTPWITWAMAMWAASLNQNLLHAETAPAAGPMEERVLHWIARAFGMAGGHMTPGSTLANLTALWAGREARGIEEIVATEACHLSIDKAANLLRLPLRKAPVAPDGSVRRDDLGDLSRAALVLTAGTTTIGAVEPLLFGSEAAWFHVDAAWAGPLRLSRQYASRLAGIEQADSVTVSAHKWLFQPKESALVMFRDPDEAHRGLSYGAGYLAKENVGLQGSHGAMALPLFATLLAWGRAGIAQRIDRCIQLAEDLEQLVLQDDRLELHAPQQTGVVVWRVRDADARLVQAELRNVAVAAVLLEGDWWLRSVAINPMADPRLVVQEVLGASERVAASVAV